MALEFICHALEWPVGNARDEAHRVSYLGKQLLEITGTLDFKKPWKARSRRSRWLEDIDLSPGSQTSS